MITEDRVRSLLAVFAERFGRPAAGVWAAPGRVNLIGEHTDYNDGFVLPFAIDRQVLAAVALRSDGLLRCLSVQSGLGGDVRVAELAPGRSAGWAAYVHGVAWALRADGVTLPGADVAVDSDVPVGAGLSSSAALEGAVASAFAGLCGAGLAGEQLAFACQRGENDYVGMPCGVMDQMASMTATAGHALFLDTRSMATRQVPLGLREDRLRVLVLDTRVSHELTSGGYADRRATCERAAEILGLPALRDATLDALRAGAAALGEVGLRRARHVVTENSRVLETVELLSAGRLADIGPLLDASHASLRDDFEVSAPELDAVTEAAVGAGALGARMTGGGFGGSAVALVPEAAVEAVTAAVLAAAAARGFPRPAIFDVQPAAGARRLR